MDKSDNTPIKRHQVFLSYASSDKSFAIRIAERLRREGVNVWFDELELQWGDSIAHRIEDAISASDYLIVLLSSHSVNSPWVQRELNSALSRDLMERDITILPVLIDDCEVPPLLASKLILDLRDNLDEGIKKLVTRVGLVPNIDFSHLDSKSFEMLIADLLGHLGFYDIQQEWREFGATFDIKANYSSADPFGITNEEVWLVEIKFYRKERADLNALYQLIGYLSGLPEKYRALLVTNGQLTSAARSFLADRERQGRVQIRVIDGIELKRLLLQTPDLVKTYFSGKQ